MHYEYQKSHEGLDSQVCRLHILKMFYTVWQHHVATLKNLLIASHGIFKELNISSEGVPL